MKHGGVPLKAGWVVHSFESGRHFYMNSRTGEVTWEMPTDLRLAGEQAAKMAKVLHEADVAMITAPMAASGKPPASSNTVAPA